VAAANEDWAELWLRFEPTARLVVDWSLSVLWSNAAADALLRANKLLRIRERLLVSPDRQVTNQIQSIIWNTKVERPTSTVVGRPDDGALLITGMSLNGPASAGVGLIVREIEVDQSVELPDLEPVFGLTAAEQAIVGLLLAGLSSGEIAAKQDKSILTVRTHVKRAYAKLGISSKEQLFAKLVRYGVVW